MSGLVQIGKIVNTHGRRGEVKVYPFTDHLERFQSLEEVFAVTPGGEKRLGVERVRFHKNCLIMKLEGCHNMDEAKALKECIIGIPEEQLWPLREDEYYYFQLVGLDVYTEEGLYLGIVEDIFPTGSNDVYIVKNDSKEYLIPAIKEVIKEVNLPGGRVIIHPLEGLLDLE